MKKNPSRLIFAGAFTVRRFYRAAETADTAAAARPRRYWKEHALFYRLSALGGEGWTVSEVLDRWYIREGANRIRKDELLCCVRDLRRFQRFRLALEVFKWMERRDLHLSFSEHGVRLDIISKAHGMVEAKSYFDRLSPPEWNKWTYGALLHNYCEKGMADNALPLFREMQDLGLGNVLAFKSLISLYLRINQPEMVRPLIKEMKMRNIHLCSYTYCLWMNSCARLNDIEGLEKIGYEIENDDNLYSDWTNHSHLADIYIKAGLFQKAQLSLRRIEGMVPSDREAYLFLIRLYSKTSNLVAVNRAWKYLKLEFPVTSTCFLIMLSALGKLDAVDELKSCFEEWQSCCPSFDPRVAKVTMKAYLRWDMLEDAQKVFCVATERSSGPFGKLRKLFMEFFLKREEMDLALGQMEAAVSEVRFKEWHPHPDLVREFFTCLEEKKDVEGAEELCRMLKKLNCLDSSAYRSLIRVYVAAGRIAPEMHQRVEEDGIEITPDLMNLLGIVCTK